MISERRRNRRIDFERPVSVTIPGGQRLSCKSVDFSMEGMGLLVDREPGLGDEVQVVVNLAPRGKPVRTVAARGRVTHCEPRVEGYGIGVHFLH